MADVAPRTFESKAVKLMMRSACKDFITAAHKLAETVALNAIDMREFPEFQKAIDMAHEIHENA